MNKFIAIALVTLAASVATVGSASALAFSEELTKKLADFKKGASSGATTEVGNPFYANAKVVDVREECDAAGGTLKRVFQGTDFVWTCIL